MRDYQYKLATALFSSFTESGKMNFLVWFLLISFVTAIASKQPIYRNHTCAPSSSSSRICVLGSLHYAASDPDVIHAFPPNQSHVRIVCDRRAFGHPRPVLVIKKEFYHLLGSPETLEVLDYAVFSVEIPRRTLRHGRFPASFMMYVTVEPGDGVPLVAYLDLSGNMLRDISAIGSLVNLEVLVLSENAITSIDPSTMKDLNKLRYLALSLNDLSEVSLGVFPKSLTRLDLFDCGITSLSYGEMDYPNLEVLNIEENHLTSIDGSRLMQAMPSLRMARIGWNHYDEDDLLDTIGLFRQHNVSFRNEADEAVCERISVEGVCLTDPKPPRSVLLDIVMSLAVIAVAVAMLAVLRWVFMAMNNK